MLCLRCRAVPSAVRSYATPGAGLRLTSPLKPTTTTQLNRPFSSAILSRLNNTNTTTTTTNNNPFPRASTPATTITTPLASPVSLASQQQSRSFSASACLAGKRRTFNPSRRTQKRRHGFLARLRTRGGRLILMRRKTKGKKALSW